MTTLTDAPARRKPIAREHILQKHVRAFARDAIDAPHELFAFDRAKAAGKFSHLVQKSRGVRAGTPDTLLRVAGIAPIWVELKAPGNSPDPAQRDIGQRLQAVGDVWFWASSVEGYRAGLVAAGVPLRPNAELLAQHHDASVAGVIETAEQKRGKAPKTWKPRAEKPTNGQLKRVAALRSKVMF